MITIFSEVNQMIDRVKDKGYRKLNLFSVTRDDRRERFDELKAASKHKIGSKDRKEHLLNSVFSKAFEHAKDLNVAKDNKYKLEQLLSK